MGYRIEYDGSSGKYEVKKEKPLGLAAMTLLCFGVFLLLTGLFWPEGREVLGEYLIPGDNQVTLHAARNMGNDLRSGAQLGDALEAFCREVIQSGN